MPDPLPFDWINAHWLLILDSSDALRVDGVNAVSVNALAPLGSLWRVVPQAARPALNVVAEAALQEPLPLDASNFTTMELGFTPVSVLLIRSFRADRDTSPFGVTLQLQQEISCSSGLKVYT